MESAGTLARISLVDPARHLGRWGMVGSFSTATFYGIQKLYSPLPSRVVPGVFVDCPAAGSATSFRIRM